MHKEMIEFVTRVKGNYPGYFLEKTVLDVGSLDINGNNRQFFTDCDYTGLDIGPGKNVDQICPVHGYYPNIFYDTIICTEMLEHDRYYIQSIKRMIQLLRSRGLLIITAATIGRKKHGTENYSAKDSPFTNDYYKNISLEMLRTEVLKTKWKTAFFEVDEKACDIRFYGIKLL
jgi:hypothetical protein